MRLFKDDFQGSVFKREGSDQKVRVLDGKAPMRKELPLQVLYEVPGLVAWVGRKDDKDRVIDAIPVFVQEESYKKLDPLTAGIVLLTDLARDFTVENRLAGHNFTLPNRNRVGEHLSQTFGTITMEYLRAQFLSGHVGVLGTKFVADRLARILKANYLEIAKDVRVDGGRIVLEKPTFIRLTALESSKRLRDVNELATWLGSKWIEAEAALLRKLPHLADRSAYFRDEPGETQAS